MEGVSHVVEDYVASGSFSRVFRVRAQRRWGQEIYAAKVMRKEPKSRDQVKWRFKDVNCSKSLSLSALID